MKTVLVVAEQLVTSLSQTDCSQLTRVEFAHSRGIILRDMNPEKFAVGLGDRSNVIHMFDFGLAKLYVNPATDEHTPFREGRYMLGTPRYASHNMHFGRGLLFTCLALHSGLSTLLSYRNKSP